MLLSASDYLLRLASLSLSFVGFTAIVVALRRAIGGQLDDYHRVSTRFFIEVGLAITSFCILPYALSYSGMLAITGSRVASAVAAVLAATLILASIRRARLVRSGPIPSLYVNSALSALPIAILCVNVVGMPCLDRYALALTLLLLLTWWAFFRSLEGFIQPPLAT